MGITHLVLDIETCPLSFEGYFGKSEEEKKKLLNPIDSRIVAIGLSFDSSSTVLDDADERELLVSFWSRLKAFRVAHPLGRLVGFNIKEFDLPFLVTRSFLQDVEIVPFKLNEVIDLREKLAAYKFGHTRGKLKEYGEALGIEILEMDGSWIAEACFKGEVERIREYLKKDLEITSRVLERLVRTRIIEIERW